MSEVGALLIFALFCSAVCLNNYLLIRGKISVNRFH